MPELANCTPGTLEVYARGARLAVPALVECTPRRVRLAGEWGRGAHQRNASDGGDVGDVLVSVAVWMAYCEVHGMCAQTRSNLEFNKTHNAPMEARTPDLEVNSLTL